MKKAIIAVPYLKGMGGTETVIKNFAEALDVKNSNNDISWKLISFGGTDKSDWLKHWNKKVYNFSKKRGEGFYTLPLCYFVASYT